MSDIEKIPLKSSIEAGGSTSRSQKEDSAVCVQNVLDRLGFGKYHFFLTVGVTIAVITEGAEVAIVSLITYILEEVWDLSSFQVGVMGGVIFVGMSFGLLVVATWGDDWGRLPVLKFTYIGALALRLLSALMPEFWSFVTVRAFTGFVQAMSMPTAVALAAESCPSKQRGSFIMLIIMTYGVGQLYVIGLAALLTPDLDGGMWRLLIVLVSLPILIGILFMFTKVVESPLFSSKRGYSINTIESLDHIAQSNNRPFLSERERMGVCLVNPPTERGSQKFKFLFDEKHRTTTVLLMIQWTLTFFSYFGFFYLLPKLLEEIDTEIDTLVLMAIIICIEISIVASFVFLIEMPSVGRKGTMKICYTSSIVINLLCIFVEANGFRIPAIMVICGLNHVACSVLWPYTSEVYETHIREMATAFVNAVGRGLSFFSPLLFGVFLELSIWVPFAFMLFLSGCLMAIALTLPIETRGMSLDTSL